MTTTGASAVLRHVRGLVAEGDGRLSDHQLLERFARQHEAAAFEALLRRHGPLVWGVCRRVLGNWHDAEDAFQAAFLALARRAAAVGRRGSVGGWLHRVAYHVALKARAETAKRQRRERQAGNACPADPLAEVTGRELLAVLDEEVQRLAERHRAPLVLCYLEGKTCDQAARQLGWSVRTLKRRLEQARDRLRPRLERRGLALPAALLATGLVRAGAVPTALTASTTRAALAAVGGAGGLVSAQVAALTNEVLNPWGVAKLPVMAALVLAATFVVAAAAAWATHAPADAVEPAAAPEPPRPAAPAKPPEADEEKPIAVTGRVHAPDGKPLAGARVAALVRQALRLSTWENWASSRNDLAAQTTTDADGRYHLAVPRPAGAYSLRQFRVVATAPGKGLAWKALNPDTDRAEIDLQLVAGQPVRGRLVGIQGEPAAGVTVHAVGVTRKVEPGEGQGDGTLRPPAALQLTATTDASGDFTLGGFGSNVKLELEVRDPRYERKEEWNVSTADPKQCENLRLVLAPGRYVEGRVIYQDTGKPVPHARLDVANPVISARTDAEGRFKVALFAARDGDPGINVYPRDVGVHVYAPPGEPYLSSYRDAPFPKGVVKREVEIALPRGVLVRGRITEAGTGRPVAGAYVECHEVRGVRVVSGPDGGYQIGVPAGRSRLLVVHPSGDYIPEVVGSAEILAGKPGGDPVYYHAAVTLNLQPEEKTKELPIMLRRGVSLKGRLLRPDGEPVKAAVMFVGGHRPRFEKTMHPIRVDNGQFEVRGCDPEKTYRLIFLEHSRPVRLLMGVEALNTYGQLHLSQLLGPENKLGAAVEIAGKQAGGEPVEVRLAPCGAARVRFVDAAGKPLAKHKPWLQLVVTPGLPANQALAEGKLAAEVITLIDQHLHHGGDPCTDGEGLITLQGLIPGATYRIKKSELAGQVLQDFTVEAGQTRELQIVVK